MLNFKLFFILLFLYNFNIFASKNKNIKLLKNCEIFCTTPILSVAKGYTCINYLILGYEKSCVNYFKALSILSPNFNFIYKKKWIFKINFFNNYFFVHKNEEHTYCCEMFSFSFGKILKHKLKNLVVQKETVNSFTTISIGWAFTIPVRFLKEEKYFKFEKFTEYKTVKILQDDEINFFRQKIEEIEKNNPADNKIEISLNNKKVKLQNFERPNMSKELYYCNDENGNKYKCYTKHNDNFGLYFIDKKKFKTTISWEESKFDFFKKYILWNIYFECWLASFTKDWFFFNIGHFCIDVGTLWFLFSDCSPSDFTDFLLTFFIINPFVMEFSIFDFNKLISNVSKLINKIIS